MPNACSRASLHATLDGILTEPISVIRERERTAFGEILSKTNNRCVLFGAGNLGRRALAQLRSVGIQPLAISDNNRDLWGTTIDSTPVLSPADAAKRYGKEAVFFVTIRNEHHWYNETHGQLSALGCTRIFNSVSLGWRFSERLLPFLLYDLPHKVYGEAHQVLAAADLWEDDASRYEYLAHVRLRALGEPLDLPRPVSESYFLDDAFDITPHDHILDCGAFDGDTIRAVLARQPNIAGIEAVEADSRSFASLKKYVSMLDREQQTRIRLHQCAVGAQRGTVSFSDTGDLDSKVSQTGGATVDLFPIDELLGDRPVTMIKMDIEGAEFDALMGARNIVLRDTPILAICVYHLQGDLWRLPLLMREMYPSYRMYLRTYCGDALQTVAYAVPPQRAAR
jgi:FkbM family methyltransferase